MDDLLDPMHGTDLDPCAICNPHDFDLTVAHLHDAVRAQVTPIANAA